MIGRRVLKSLVGAGVIASLAAFVSPANAITKFDPTGTGTFVRTLNNLDWQPGNSIAVSGITALNNFLANQQDGGNRSVEFDFYYQAVLGTYKNIGENAKTMPDGSELTIVVGIREKVVAFTGPTGATGAVATFRLVPSATEFFEIYYDDNASTLVDEAANLQGTGFNDGQLILRADITKLVDTVFTLSNANAGALDQTNGDNTANGGIGADNDYPGIGTVQGNGSTTLTAKVTEFDSDFFFFDPSGPAYVQLTMLQNIGVDLPFLSVDPSSGFVTSANAGAIGTSGPAPNLNLGPGTVGVDPLTDGPSSVGTHNGSTGPDVVFQTDTNETFVTVPVPEPVTASLAMMGFGALALVGLRRRR